MDKNGVYNCILLQSKCPNAVIRKIKGLKNYRNETLSSCRFITGESDADTENEAFAFTLFDYFVQKHKLKLNDAQEKDLLLGLMFLIEKADELAKTKYKKTSKF